MQKNEKAEAYISGLTGSAGNYANTVRNIVSSTAPDATEDFKYGMPAYKINNEYIFYMGAWKKHVGIYPVSKHYDFEAEIIPYRSQKDSLKLSYTEPLPEGLLGKIIRQRMTDILAGKK